MRIISAAAILPCLVGAAAPQPAPPARVDLPYSACEPMANLRTNLTGTPYPTAKGDAILRRLGVRCVGEPYLAVARPRY